MFVYIFIDIDIYKEQALFFAYFIIVLNKFRFKFTLRIAVLAVSGKL